jgi:hypothetical protein
MARPTGTRSEIRSHDLIVVDADGELKSCRLRLTSSAFHRRFAARRDSKVAAPYEMQSSCV